MRTPAVNGQFYPDSRDGINEFIENCLAVDPGNAKNTSRMKARGIILPHAGYIYSGKVAVATVSKILPAARLLILGPNHTGLGERFSLWPKDAWEIPGTSIPVDEKLVAGILASGNMIKADRLAHLREHSIEVQLPILQYFFARFSFAAITCQTAGLAEYEKIADQICSAVNKQKEDVLLVASSDMTHYEPDAAARKKDALVLEHIVGLDPEGMLKTIETLASSMCGAAPVAILLCCLRRLGARKAQVALYQTSGDASGDYNEVVGYAGVIIQ